MTAEERYKITSNDYTDILVEYNRNTRIFDRFPNSTPHIMNDRFAVLYIPVGQLTSRSISQFGYSIIPAVFGLNSERSLEASNIIRLRRLPTFNLRGEGVLLGFIDTGIDYTNPIFTHADGTTKIMALWDQTIESDKYPVPYYYGTQYLADDINQALKSNNPYDIVPSKDDIGHGTMLAGIAAGNEVPASDFSGVVPDSDLIIVKLKQAKTSIMNFYVLPEGVIGYQENDIMWGVQYVVEHARSLHRPVVICIGVGSSQGSHDGRGALSSLLSVNGNFPGVAVCIAAGNEGNSRRHFYAEIDKDIGYSTVELNVGDNEPGFSMELWGTAPNTYSIDILSPAGEYIPRIAESLRVNRDISFVFEKTTITIDYQMVESATGDQLIIMRFRNPTPGIWRFQVYGRGDLRSTFNIWLPMGKFITENTYFVQSDPYTTITSPGNSLIPITVTAYNPDNNTLYQRASRGFSRINVVKPEIAAPGVNIQAPTLDHGFTNMTGTSAAAAHAAGAAAIIFEWGIVKGNYPGIDTVEVKKFMIRGADKNPGLVYPNRDWGYGILDVYNVFDILRVEFQRVTPR
ncbi:MAG TPA: S8 family peptidase [Mobilitalea sp.]|nr:S8 family peptidase [Mobilitalea sp.]